MKILKYVFVFNVLLYLCSCSSKEKTDKLKVDVSGIGVNLEMIDISKDFYNLQTPVSEFRKKYPFYLDKNVSDQKYEQQRRDSTELNIYNQINKKINQEKLKNNLTDLFRHIKYYYPEFKVPKVYLYSSFVQDYLNPVTYVPQQNYLFIATDCFLGYDNKYYNYQKIYKYIQNSMTPEYITSKVSKAIIDEMNWIPKDFDTQSFVSQMIYYGKALLLQDAFQPNLPDQYKIGYNKEQIDWAKSNEFEIWQFFIKNNYLFSDDTSLADRFLSFAPFSKFYTEADAKSPGQIGCWVGWQICKKYLQENPKVTVQDIIKNTHHEEIFSRSGYKPLEISEQ